jgi:hypothetical protein
MESASPDKKDKPIRASDAPDNGDAEVDDDEGVAGSRAIGSS